MSVENELDIESLLILIHSKALASDISQILTSYSLDREQRIVIEKI